jgi:hypothetical protein
VSGEDELRRLVARFAFCLDDRDFDTLATLLSDDCLLESAGEFCLDGRVETIAEIAANVAEHPGRHLLGPTVIDLEDTGSASGWTDMVAVFPGADGSLSILGTWRYHDRFARDDGRWVFTHRYLHKPAQELASGAPALPSAHGRGEGMEPSDQIKRLVAMYAFCLDDRDYDALASMLGADCLLAVGEYRLTGRDEIVASVSGMQSQDPGRHLLGPTLVELDGPERASAWTDMVGIVPGPDGTQVIAGTWRYHDRLALIDQRWVFTHRYLLTPAQPPVEGAPALPV